MPAVYRCSEKVASTTPKVQNRANRAGLVISYSSSQCLPIYMIQLRELLANIKNKQTHNKVSKKGIEES